MAPSALEREDKARDAAFNKALHGKSAKAQGGLAAMRGKDAAAQKAAVDEYFKHWDNQAAADETPEMREVRQCAAQSIALITNNGSVTGPQGGICHPHPTVCSLPDSPQLIATHTNDVSAATTTWLPISTSTDGVPHSTSAVSPTVSLSTRPLPATSTTSPTWLVSPRT